MDDDRFDEGGHKPLKNVLATKVAEKIASEKREKMQLLQDLEGIKDQFVEIEVIMKKQEMGGNINRAAQLLQDIHYIKFYGVLFILFQMQDNYFKDKKCQKEILFINDVIQKLSHQQDLKIAYNNGYHVNYAVTALDRMDIDANVFKQDYDSYFKAMQPVIDEEALNPPEFNLISGIYLTNSLNLVTFKKNVPYMGALFHRDYRCLDYALTNLSKEIRKYAMQNINSNELTLQNYVLARTKMDEKDFKGNPTIYAQILQEKKNYLKTQIRARQSRRIMMIVKSKAMLSMDITEYNKVFAQYHEEMLWKINHHMDGIAKARQGQVDRELANQKRKNPAEFIKSSMR